MDFFVEDKYFTKMNNVTFKGKPLKISEPRLHTGDFAPEFTLTSIDLEKIQMKSFTSDYLLLNIVPSVDTPVCAASAREFDRSAVDFKEKCEFLTISRDLPFAQTRFSEKESLANTTMLSDMSCGDFASQFGVLITEGALEGLCTRAVYILGPRISGKRKILYSEMVPEIAWEPDYEKVIKALHKHLKSL